MNSERSKELTEFAKKNEHCYHGLKVMTWQIISLKTMLIWLCNQKEEMIATVIAEIPPELQNEQDEGSIKARALFHVKKYW